VFLPMVFVEGIAGQAFGDLGLAVVTSLLAALVVALALIPMLASRSGTQLLVGEGGAPPLYPTGSWHRFRRDASHILARWGHRPQIRHRLLPLAVVLVWLTVRLLVGTLLEVVGKLLLGLGLGLILLWRRALGPLLARSFGLLTRPLLRLTDGAMEGMNRHYPRILRSVLGHPVLMSALTALCIGLTVVMALRLDNELLPEVHQGELTFELQLPVGTPLERTEKVLAPLESALLAERDHIRALLVTFGYDPTTSQRSDEGEHTARFKLVLDSSDPRVEEQVVTRLRHRLASVPDLAARVTRPVLFSFQTPIEVEVHADDLVELRRMAERVRDVMAALPELADVETTQRPGSPEVQIVYDREQLARYGLNVGRVAEQVRNAVRGFEASRYNLGDRRIPIVVRLQEDDRRRVSDVEDFLVNPGGGRPIPLSSVARVALAEGPSEVRRVDGRRVALVTANVAEGSLGGAVARVESELRGAIEWPDDMSFLVAGQSQEWDRSRDSLLLALALSIFLVYVIMAAQFESLMQPLVIMLTIPLAFLGTMAALLALEISLSIVVFLGMIMLAGIVVNNAIVLLDYVNTLRERGMDRVEAVITAGTVRLRPILMTTATTVLGLAPMALGLGDGAEIRTPMAIAVISGLLVSTVLTLIVIPSAYVVVEQLLDRLAGRAPEAAAAAATAPEAAGAAPGLSP